MPTSGVAPKQSSESELVWQFFERRRDGVFVEVGACRPRIGSQSWFLEEHGWRGVLIEPQPDLAEELRGGRPRSLVFQVACTATGHPEQSPFHVAEAPSHSSLLKNGVDASTKYVRTEMVKLMTLDAVLEQAPFNTIDFISIDVEGTQLDVLKGFSLQRHRPALLLIEDHLHNLKVHRHIRRHGYRLVKRTNFNNWYIPKERPFVMTTLSEQLRLWKKVWANTPFRKLRIWLEKRRATR
jgi:FkbM family methyltransferase